MRCTGESPGSHFQVPEIVKSKCGKRSRHFCGVSRGTTEISTKWIGNKNLRF